MNVWKLEWLRLVRTRRLLVLFAVFMIFGFVGPLTARYLPEILGNSAGDSNIKVTVESKPTPADGFREYMSNISQLGLLAVVIIAAYSLAVDAKTSLSIFYRTRVAKTVDLLFPRLTVVTLAAVCAFVVGTFTAWYETTALLGHVATKDVLVGGLYLCVYWVFCTATVAIAASLVRSVLAVAGLSLGFLLLYPIAGSVKSLKRWWPSALTSSLTGILSNQHDAAYYYKPMMVTIGVIIVFLGVALLRIGTREVES